MESSVFRSTPLDVVEGPHRAYSEEIVYSTGVEAVPEQSVLNLTVREEGEHLVAMKN